MKDFDPDEYPLYKLGHSTSTLLICMFLGFTLGFLACHEIYAGIEKRLVNSPKVEYNKAEVD